MRGKLSIPSRRPVPELLASRGLQASEMEVRIVNRNKFALPGRYAAVDYSFPPGKPVAISRVAADHIFGLREQNKTRALNCLGILKVGVT